MKKAIGWLKGNWLPALVFAFVVALVLMPFVAVPLLKLRSRIPGINKIDAAVGNAVEVKA